MKKVLNYLRSMRFGILLLVMIALCSVAGSLIPQGREISFYAQNYRSFHGVILMLRLNRVFESWYFIVLLVLLGLNLTFCSLVRIFSLVGNRNLVSKQAAGLPDTVFLSQEGVRALEDALVNRRCRVERFGAARVYRKNNIGRYGSFLTHLSILLTLVIGALALYTPTVIDQSCLPGEALTMADGTRIGVHDFTIENPTGQLDFTSEIQITLPDGRDSGPRIIRVNHPCAFGSYKVYQQTYGTAGSITVTNLQNGGSDTFTLTEEVFLSLDGANGLWYEALYPGYLRDPSGNVTLITSTSGHYDDPVYQVLTASDGVYTPVLAFPGDELQIGELKYSFNAPVEYPGLRIKYTPPLVNALLIAVFVLMTAALFITFFLAPVVVKVDDEGYTVTGPKPEGMRIELGDVTAEYERKSEE